MKIKVNLEKYNQKELITGIRLNKYLSDIGILSRREADKLIIGKLIHLNDKIAILGEKVKNNDNLSINLKLNPFKYYKYNKPRGEETQYKIIDKIRYEPIGRLDKESDGLLLYSNDFRIVEALLNPKNKIEREYIVQIKEKATPRVKNILEKGITTQEGKYAPVKSVLLNEEKREEIKITLTEGKKHEIRRMLNALNLTITSLKRVRILFLTLSKMKPKEIKELTEIEKEKILETLKLK